MEIEISNCHLFLKVVIFYFRLSVLLSTQKEENMFYGLFDFSKLKKKRTAFIWSVQISEKDIFLCEVLTSVDWYDDWTHQCITSLNPYYTALLPSIQCPGLLKASWAIMTVAALYIVRPYCKSVITENCNFLNN